jgi:hypothetical protein
LTSSIFGGGGVGAEMSQLAMNQRPDQSSKVVAV